LAPAGSARRTGSASSGEHDPPKWTRSEACRPVRSPEATIRQRQHDPVICDCIISGPAYPFKRRSPFEAGTVVRGMRRINAFTYECSLANFVRPTTARERVEPHVLRHTAAMRIPHAGIDIAVIALWL